jgi:hypothetical protein
VAYYVSVTGDINSEEYIQFHTDKADAVSSPPANAINLLSNGYDFELIKDFANTINYHIYGAELLSGCAVTGCPE